MSPPNDEPLLRLFFFRCRQQKIRQRRPNAIAAAPTPATATPAICGLVRTGCAAGAADDVAGAAEALIEGENAVGVVMLLDGTCVRKMFKEEEEEEEEEKDDEDDEDDDEDNEG